MSPAAFTIIAAISNSRSEEPADINSTRGPIPEEEGGLTLTTERSADTGRITLRGELDLASAEELARALGEFQSAAISRIVVDLANLQFIDSTGLRTLIQAHVRAEREGQELVIVPGPASVQRVFELTRTIDVLRFQDA